MEMKFADECRAVAAASSVFPQPGGPKRREPEDGTMPAARNWDGKRLADSVNEGAGRTLEDYPHAKIYVHGLD